MVMNTGRESCRLSSAKTNMNCLVQFRSAIEEQQGERVRLFALQLRQMVTARMLYVSSSLLLSMIETDPDPIERTLYACLACGTGVDNPDSSECPNCGGLLRNTTVDHD